MSCHGCQRRTSTLLHDWHLRSRVCIDMRASLKYPTSFGGVTKLAAAKTSDGVSIAGLNMIMATTTKAQPPFKGSDEGTM